MIYHILKDGTAVDSIEGLMIKADDFPVLYETINRIMEEGEMKSDRNSV